MDTWQNVVMYWYAHITHEGLDVLHIYSLKTLQDLQYI